MRLKRAKLASHHLLSQCKICRLTEENWNRHLEQNNALIVFARFPTRQPPTCQINHLTAVCKTGCLAEIFNLCTWMDAAAGVSSIVHPHWKHHVQSIVFWAIDGDMLTFLLDGHAWRWNQDFSRLRNVFGFMSSDSACSEIVTTS